MDFTRKTWVYLAHCGNDLRKVGASVDPAKRMVLLESEHRWLLEFILERTWHRPSGDARAVEITVHRYLRKVGVEQRQDLGREFFVAEAAAIAGVIEWAHLRIPQRTHGATWAEAAETVRALGGKHKGRKITPTRLRTRALVLEEIDAREWTP